jgi:hypothetical protein
MDTIRFLEAVHVYMSTRYTLLRDLHAQTDVKRSTAHLPLLIYH